MLISPVYDGLPYLALENRSFQLASHHRLSAGPHDRCQMLGDAFSYAVQLLLFLFCFGSLMLKWALETPQRTLKVFFLDTAKQIAAAGWMHIFNMASAVLMRKTGEGGADECAWYWINLVCDCTFGLLICWMCLRASENMYGYQSGNYKDKQANAQGEFEPNYWIWAGQILLYLCAITAAKLVVLFMLFVGLSMWADVGIWATAWVKDEDWRLVWVMIVTPCVMDTLYFWITDEFIKYEEDDSDDEKERGANNASAEAEGTLVRGSKA